jgi:hypothetical protein
VEKIELIQVKNSRVLPPINADEGCFRKDVLTGFALDVGTCWVFSGSQMVDRERKQPEVIMVQSMLMWRAGAAKTALPEVIDRLLEAVLPWPLGGSLRQAGNVSRNVICGPMAPGAAGRIGIVAE